MLWQFPHRWFKWKLKRKSRFCICIWNTEILMLYRPHNQEYGPFSSTDHWSMVYIHIQTAVATLYLLCTAADVNLWIISDGLQLLSSNVERVTQELSEPMWCCDSKIGRWSGQTSFLPASKHFSWLDNWRWFPCSVSFFLLGNLFADLLRQAIRDQAGRVCDHCLPLLSRVEVNVLDAMMGGGEDGKQVYCYPPPTSQLALLHLQLGGQGYNF